MEKVRSRMRRPDVGDRIMKIHIRRRKERKIYNGFDAGFYGL
jgi:hypothetical protein